MLGTLIFLIASFIVILLLTAIADIIANWWKYLFIIIISVIAVAIDTHKRNKK